MDLFIFSLKSVKVERMVVCGVSKGVSAPHLIIITFNRLHEGPHTKLTTTDKASVGISVQ